MNRKLLFCFVLTINSLLTMPAFAQSRQTGKIIGYIPYENASNANLIFQIENNVSGTCNTTARFAMSGPTEKYKTTVKAVMVAFHTKTEVTVLYSPSCNSWGNAYDVIAVCVGPVPC
jgi:hypothetical protein